MEIIFEIIFELLFELVFELLIDTGWRGVKEAFGEQQPSWIRRVIGVVFVTLIAGAVGSWRGTEVGGLGWGWWVTLVIAVLATIATLVRWVRPAGPRPASGAALRWWPAARCAWFAIANAVFVIAYAVAAAAVTAPTATLR